MTSQQIKTRFADAVSLLAMCEHLLEDPYVQERHWELVDLKHRVQGFMDHYRQHLAEGGAA
ncbi:MAG: hypothetical protein EBS23_00815 [Betaproteobacteria bacterium]|nr:hypothetical protein [Betaproteobacteria bacterium]